MQKKYEIEKEKPDEILEARKQTKDKREDKRLQAAELRILRYTNEDIVHILRVHNSMDPTLCGKRNKRATK